MLFGLRRLRRLRQRFLVRSRPPFTGLRAHNRVPCSPLPASVILTGSRAFRGQRREPALAYFVAQLQALAQALLNVLGRSVQLCPQDALRQRNPETLAETEGLAVADTLESVGTQSGGRIDEGCDRSTDMLGECRPCPYQSGQLSIGIPWQINRPTSRIAFNACRNFISSLNCTGFRSAPLQTPVISPRIVNRSDPCRGYTGRQKVEDRG